MWASPGRHTDFRPTSAARLHLGGTVTKVAVNHRAAILFARIFFVWSVIVIGLAPRARADNVQSYQYTVTFGSLTASDAPNGSSMNMQLRFVVSGLLGDAVVNIDPNHVQVLEAPVAPVPKEDANFAVGNDQWTSAPLHLVSLAVSDNGVADAYFSIEVHNPHGCLNPDCSAFIDGHWQRDDDYQENLYAPITAVGTYIPHDTHLTDHGFGDYPLGETFNVVNNFEELAGTGDSISVVATPEPNTGFLVGACFLLSVAVVLRRRIPSY